MPTFSVFVVMMSALFWSTSSWATVTAQPTVIHGVPAEADSAPWQVALYAETEQGMVFSFCSGTLIDAQWVLTAAHCIQPLKDINNSTLNVTKYFAVVGEVDLNQVANSAQAQVIEVEQRISHPDYVAELNLDNDIALLALNRPVDFAQCGAGCQVLPWLQAGRAEKFVFEGSPAQVAGWGRMTFDVDGEYQSSPSWLQVGQLKITACPNEYYTYQGKNWPMSVNMLCADGRDPVLPADTCVGDSGTGLVVNLAAAQPFLAGITSWGEKAGCGERTIPAVYTKVSNYDDWILSYVDPAAYAEQQAEEKSQMSTASSSGGGGSFSIVGVLLLSGLGLLRRVKRL